MPTDREEPPLLLFSALDATTEAAALLERLRGDEVEVEHDHAPSNGTPWPKLMRVEQILEGSVTPAFLLSPDLAAVLTRNRSLAEAIYARVARGAPVHLILTNVSQPIPPCFLSLAGVEFDHFLTSGRAPAGRRTNTHRTDIRDIVQRKEPSRRAALLVPNAGASPNSLGYEVIEIADPLNDLDKSYIAAFVSEPFRIAAACADIVKFYPAWKSARIRSAIVRKPRAAVQDKGAMLDHIARELQLDRRNVFYLDDYIRLKTAAFTSQSYPLASAPIYVPIAARLNNGSKKAWVVEDALKAIDEWRTRPHCPIMLVGGEGGTGKTHVVREANERWNRSSDVRAHSIDSHTFIQKFETRLASNAPIEVYDIYLACGREDDRDRLDKESFYDHWLNGTYILTIDGIDEIANRAPGDFSLGEFFQEVLRADTEGFGKLLVTAREFLLTDDLRDGLDVCELLPFDETRAQSFFKKTYDRFLDATYAISQAKVVERSMREAKALQRGQSQYVPYVLSLIAESYIESDDGDAVLSLEHDTDTECANLTEFVVSRICQRERLRIKDQRIGVEEQRRLLELLSAEGPPGVSEERYRRLIRQVVDGGISENVERFLLSHLLLSRRSVEGTGAQIVWFRYDFHAEHFLASLVARYIKQNVSAISSQAAYPLPLKPAEALVEHRGYDDLLVVGVAEQLAGIGYDDLVQGILSTMQTADAAGQDSKRYLDAALFNIALRKELTERGDGADTQPIMSGLLKDLFGASGITVSRIPRQVNRRMIVDFSGMTVQYGFFEDWHDFFMCTGNETTRFEKCVVSRCGADARGGMSLTEHMFDRTTCTLDDLAQARLVSETASSTTKEEAIKESLRRLFGAFRSGVGLFRAHAGKNWFRGRGFANMPAANLLSAEKFAGALIKSGLIIDGEDRRGGHYALNLKHHVDVADFVEQARESKIIREAVRTLVKNAR